MPLRGLEPPHLSAYAPKAYVYTNFTTAAALYAQKESNLHHQFRRLVLYPLSYGRIPVSPAGIEPATSSLEGKRSIQLSYGDRLGILSANHDILKITMPRSKHPELSHLSDFINQQLRLDLEPPTPPVTPDILTRTVTPAEIEKQQERELVARRFDPLAQN